MPPRDQILPTSNSLQLSSQQSTIPPKLTSLCLSAFLRRPFLHIRLSSISRLASMTIEPSVPSLPMIAPGSPPEKRRKLTGREFYVSLGSPQAVIAPMVDQSELVTYVLIPPPPSTYFNIILGVATPLQATLTSKYPLLHPNATFPPLRIYPYLPRAVLLPTT